MRTAVLTFIAVVSFVGCLAEEGDLGEKCVANTDNCKDLHAFCDDRDARNKMCQCKGGWVRRGSKCVRGVNQPCGKSQCLQYGTCQDGVCVCDSSMGYVANAANTSCGCPTNQVMRTSDGKCLKKITEECEADSECVDSAVCSESTCTCDATKFHKANADNTACVCDAERNARLETNTCVLTINQPCTDTSQCYQGVEGGVICDTTCQCDTNNHFISGGSPCRCAENYVLKADKTCGLHVGQECNADHLCLDNARCVTDTETNSDKCTCDASKHRVKNAEGTKCVCDDNTLEDSDGICRRRAGEACASTSECIDNAICSDAGQCACDITKNWGTSSNKLCICSSTEMVNKADGGCGLRVGQECNADHLCLDNARCVTDTETNSDKCTCDASKHRVSNEEGTECVCDDNTLEDSDGICRKKVGQSCGHVSECIDSVGMMCSTVDDKQICTCDTNKHYGAVGDTSCGCTPKDTFYQDPWTGECMLKVGMNCSANNAFCVPGAVCHKKSLKCMCDTTNNYVAGQLGATACQCDETSVRISNTHYCGKKLGGTCTSENDADTCTDHASCVKNENAGIYSCKCSGTPNPDGSCSSGGASWVASLAALATGLLLTSAIM